MWIVPILGYAVICGCSGPRHISTPHPPATSAQDAALEQVHRQPNNPAARLQLAEQYADSGETFAATEQMEVARELGDHDESLALRLDELYSKLGEPEEAAEVLATAASRPGVSAALRLAYSQAELKLGDFQKAADAVRPLIPQMAALKVDDQQYVVRAFVLAGDAEQAAKLLPPQSTDAEWLALRGLQEMLAGQPRQAVGSLAQAVTRAPQDAWTLYLLGRAYLLAGDRQQALDAWGRSTQLQGAPPESYIGAAHLLAESGRLDEANTVVQRVQGDDRNRPSYWQVLWQITQRSKLLVLAQTARGFAAYNSGDPWQAESIWRAALPQAQGSDTRGLYSALYNSASRRQDVQAALRYTTEATARWPQDPYFLKARAELLLELDRLAEARTVAERLLEITPPEQAAKAAELLSRIALDASQPDLLRQSAQRNRELAPNDPLPLLHLAEWQSKQGQAAANLQRTLQLYQQASALAPDNPEAAAYAGIVLKDLNRPQEARTLLLHALTLSPRVLDGTPNVMLAQLEQRQGLTLESRFEIKQYQRLRNLKDNWARLLKPMYQDQPAPTLADWRALGEMALQQHETWIALCAFTRAARLAPKDPVSWQRQAEALKRLGRFEEALDAMHRSYLVKRGDHPLKRGR